MRWLSTALLSAILALGLCGPARAQGNPDILWNIVHNCLDQDAASRAAACPAPRQTVGAACNRSTEVWGETPGQFVVIRDIKMCACPGTGFVHGLAIPFTKVSGVEATNRPDGIWSLAWQVAETKIGTADKARVALAVNPRGVRSQEQLHIHIVRLRSDYLDQVKAHPDWLLKQATVQDLSEVWHAALPPEQPGTAFANFGLLVTAAEGGGYLVRTFAASISPEGEFTDYRCPS